MQPATVLTIYGAMLIVSILIRPEGRMQLVYGGRWHNPSLVSVLIRPSGRMQPLRQIPPGVLERVSILIRPSGRMQPLSDFNPVGKGMVVSILIRPSGRMQQWWHRMYPSAYAFQSSSGQKAGCNTRWWQVAVAHFTGFQSSSGQKAGCNTSSAISGPLTISAFQSSSGLLAGCNNHRRSDVHGDDPVSILIRPSGRMQRLYLNFLSVLREPPDTGLPICFHCPDHFFPPATIQLRTRTSRLQWFRHGVRVRPPAVP